MQKVKITLSKISLTLKIIFTLSLFSGCAADLEFSQTTTTTGNNPLNTQNAASAALIGSYVTFNYSDYYSLSSPNPATGCAGDAHTYYDPLAYILPSYPTGTTSVTGVTGATGPLKLPQNINDPSTTIRPAFIKNISVDMTDANANVTMNNAFNCSLGSGPTSPPVSNCATFDYGAIDGIPSTMGGSFVFFGGFLETNFTGIQTSLPTTPHGHALTCGPTYPLSSGTLGQNSCSANMYILSVNSLPASAATGNSDSLAPGLSSATTSISAWANLSAASDYIGPPAIAGGAATYNSILKKILLIGGATYLTGLGSSPGGGIYTYDTWTYDLKLQKWTKTTQNIAVSETLQTTTDFNPSLPTVSQTKLFSKVPGGRALFGYTALAGAAIDHLSNNGLVLGANGSGIDTTDRIFVVGGYGGCAYGSSSNGVCSNTLRFNPTYGPEYFDVEFAHSPISANNNTFAPTQWIDSYYSQIASNRNSSSELFPGKYTSSTNTFPRPTPTPTVTSEPTNQISFGLVAVNNNFPTTSGGGGVGVTSYASPLPSTVNTAGAGYLLSAGGFYGMLEDAGKTNVPQLTAHGLVTCNSINKCGGMQIGLKWFNSSSALTWTEATEMSAANFSYATNYLGNFNQSTPIQWAPILDSNTLNSKDTVPWFGGGVLLKGINVPTASLSFPSPNPPGLPPLASIPPEATNQVVFFGGSDCREYLADSSATCPNWDPNASPPKGNPGRYWNLGIDPSYTYHAKGDATNAGTPRNLDMGGSPPLAAGMSAARGLDADGNPIIVAWGGMIAPARVDSTGTIYYLYYNTTDNQPAWAATTPATGGPLGLGNAAMVYSHATGKFYLFGGVNSTVGTSADTWELTMTPISGTSCGKSASPNCKFDWRLLTTSNGMTCYPNCPPARRSHRMVEANYHYFNAPFEPNCKSASRPCSFGIFMEGGSANGIPPFFSDRWMFDPTANGGAGHWQEMGEMPPRTLASTATVDYFVPGTQKTVHRAILFGGETGLQDPIYAADRTGGFFVPPTLGDTWMFDYDTMQWQRVNLFGHRYHTSAVGAFSTFNETEARSSYIVGDTTSLQFSPPPTSGGIMVTRTQSKANHLASDSARNLAIPEVFFFGGRKKDGNYNLLSTVYKFCAGTTGEKPFPTSPTGVIMSAPDDASCDSFDPDTNNTSHSPSDAFVGRWLLKSPLGLNGLNSSQIASFMGAGAYDSVHDLIVFYGGLTPNTAPFGTAAVTDSTNRTVNSEIYEYTPPSAVANGPASSEFNGAWNRVPVCAESLQVPVGRYGHSMGYDPVNRSIVTVGGFDINGTPLTQTQTYFDGRNYVLPETWAAYRIDHPLIGGNSALNIPEIINGPFPCYYWSNITTYGNAIDIPAQAPPMTGLAHSSSIYIPSAGYNTGYYTTFDSSCINSGPIASADSSINKLLIGGVYFDIDRNNLGPHENLILNLTILPLGPTNNGPDQRALGNQESAIFKVHLVKVGESGDVIRQRTQPRVFTYAATDQYPEVAKNLSIITPSSGQIRQEQILIPLSMDPGIDRIRVERYSGSAILIDATLLRTGQQ